MAVILIGTGGLFKRLGEVNKAVLDLDALRGGAATARVLSGASMVTHADNLDSYYAETVANQDTLEGLYTALEAWQGTGANKTFVQYLFDLMRDTVIDMVDVDSPLDSRTLTLALGRLIEQMKASGDDVDATSISVGAQTAVGSPTGDPHVLVSAKSPLDGIDLQYAPSDTLRFRCTVDSYGGTVTAGRETFSVKGAAAVSDATSHLWPGGSGATKTLAAIDASQSESSTGNILSNSDFEDWTANVPDDWTTVTGTPGTDFDDETSVVYGGSKALVFNCDGSDLPAIKQQFGSGTSVTLKPSTVYAVSFRARDSGAGLLAGVLQVDLIDAGGSIVTDALGTENKIQVAHDTLTDSYVAYGGFFRTPAALSSASYAIRVWTSTAGTNTEKIYLDHLSMCEATSLGAGLPWVSVHSGATEVVAGDQWTVAVTTTWGSIQKALQRAFGMRALGLTVPADTGGSETVADSLFE